MPTVNQLIRKGRRGRKGGKYKELGGAPHKRGVVLRVYVIDPRKPNSANRKVCRVRLVNGYEVTAAIPGEKHTISEHSVVLVCPGSSPDLSGVRFKVVMGALDARIKTERRKGRSKFGVKKPR